MQSVVIATVMDVAAATPLVEDADVATPRCQQKVWPQLELKVFVAMCEVSQSKTKPSRIIKWVSGVPITRRRYGGLQAQVPPLIPAAATTASS
jgi:hypothetical protein